MHYFYEKNALDDKGNLLVDKVMAINKVTKTILANILYFLPTGMIKIILLLQLAHGIHLVHPVFKKYTFNDRVRNVARTIGLRKPVIVQGMMNFKHKKVGGPGKFEKKKPLHSSR